MSLNNVIPAIAERRVTYNDVVKVNTHFILEVTAPVHEGRWFAHNLGISCDEKLQKMTYHQDCVDYILNNYQIREVEDIVKDDLKLGIEWKEIEKDVYSFKNYTITCNHLNYSVDEKIKLSDNIEIVESLTTRYIEDAFEYARRGLSQ